MSLHLRLYVAGNAPNSVAARANLQCLLDERGLAVELEVIDLLREPGKGLRDGILVTPTLVRTAPGPEQRIIGDLRDRSALLLVLGLEGGGSP
jgi:circadian clock protein KaiB